MKKLLLVLLFVPLVCFGQNYFFSENPIEINEQRLYEYLDFVNNSLAGGSINQSLFQGKQALYATEMEMFNQDGSAELVNEGEILNYYVHTIHNKKVVSHLGLNGLGGVLIYTKIYSLDNNKNKPSNIFGVESFMLLQRKYSSYERVKELTNKLTNKIDKYYRNKYNMGLLNKNTSYGVSVLNGGGIVDELNNYKIMNFDIKIGTASSGKGINDGWSHILYINFEDRVKASSLIEDASLLRNSLMSEMKFKSSKGYDIDLREINNYDLKAMIDFFIEDSKRRGIRISNNMQIKAVFEELEGNIIGLAYGKNNDSLILLKIDPKNWANSSMAKRWYLLYHELGHDVLNLDHGEGGKMMFNFINRDYSFDEFIEDKKYMLKYSMNN